MKLAGSLSLLVFVSGVVLGCTRASREEVEAGGSKAGGANEIAAGEHGAVANENLAPYEYGTMTRLHTKGGVFLASQPQPSDFEEAKRWGVKSVINLRHAEENTEFDETAVVAGLGMNYYNLPWNGPDELTDRIIDDSRELLRTVERPVLLHCSSANRVGTVWIPYRVLDEGADLEAAVEEAKMIGLKSRDYEARARDYVERKQGVE